MDLFGFRSVEKLLADDRLEWISSLQQQTKVLHCSFSIPYQAFHSDAYLEFVPVVANHPTFRSVVLEFHEYDYSTQYKVTLSGQRFNWKRYRWDKILDFVGRVRAEELPKKIERFVLSIDSPNIVFPSNLDPEFSKSVAEEKEKWKLLSSTFDTLCISRLDFKLWEYYERVIPLFRSFYVENVCIVMRGFPTKEDIDKMKKCLEFPFVEPVDTLFVVIEDYLLHNWMSLVDCFDNLRSLPPMNCFSMIVSGWTLHGALRVLRVIDGAFVKPKRISLCSKIFTAVDEVFESEIFVNEVSLAILAGDFKLEFKELILVYFYSRMRHGLKFFECVAKLMIYKAISYESRTFEEATTRFQNSVTQLHCRGRGESTILSKELLSRFEFSSLERLSLEFEDEISLSDFSYCFKKFKSLRCLELKLSVTNSMHLNEMVTIAKFISSTCMLTHFSIMFYELIFEPTLFKILMEDCISLDYLALNFDLRRARCPTDLLLDLLASNSYLQRFSTNTSMKIQSSSQFSTLTKLLKCNNTLVMLEADIILKPSITAAISSSAGFTPSCESQWSEIIRIFRMYNRTLCTLMITHKDWKMPGAFENLFSIIQRNLLLYRQNLMLCLLHALRRKRQTHFDRNCLEIILKFQGQAIIVEKPRALWNDDRTFRELADLLDDILLSPS